MTRSRRWSKAAWATLISALVWVPVLLLAVWSALRPVAPGANPYGGASGYGVVFAVVGFIVSLAVVWVVLSIAIWLYRFLVPAGDSGRRQS